LQRTRTRRLSCLTFFLGGFLTVFGPCHPALAQEAPAATSDINRVKLNGIAEVVNNAIREKKTPGAVVIVGHRGQVVYRKAFGNRALVPKPLATTVDTVYDVASLTKVIATTTAAMQLFEQGKIRLDDPVAAYWPEFGANGKDKITVRELMTHFSGLAPDLGLKTDWSGYGHAMQMIIAEAPIAPPGTRFIYSDINFETLGELVRRLSGEPLEEYCAKHIFEPLGMANTAFKPLSSGTQFRERIAPTQHQFGKTGKILRGEVHDPTSYRMGGVAGHAGLFSTADDLAIFAQMLLDGGSYHGVQILSPLTVQKMTTPQSPPGQITLRGLGWDIDSPFASNRGTLFPVGSYGHTGYTGPSIWIDPISQTYVIIMSNRVHPNGTGDVVAMRSKIATLVAAALGPASTRQILASTEPMTGRFELDRGYRTSGTRNGNIRTGIDVLEEDGFAPLKGLRVGLITNQTGRDSEGRRTIDLLARAPGVKLTAIFTPEHGLLGQADEPVESGKDTATGLPIYSLYGEVNRPTPEMLEGLDALVFDIQDAGARFYTYVTTMGYAMEAAAQKGIAFFVLDRPNPLSGVAVEGPVLDQGLESFVGYFPLPVRHGMTVGELAEMFNGQLKLKAKLQVIKMRDWQRSDWYDETGLVWINPSPNLRTLAENTLYPGVAMIEGANVSVGRGTPTPFELVGAPWIDSRRLAAFLNERRIQGIRFIPQSFQPASNKYAGETCKGIQIVLLDRLAFDSAELGVELASALFQLYPDKFELEKTLQLIGSKQVLGEIRAGQDPRAVALHWQSRLEEFRTLRTKYLLY
jgi:uncharacterized protein YbbC (DUF1343 family)/CubicO group peptidase (beta-lactamase class C family)